VPSLQQAIDIVRRVAPDLSKRSAALVIAISGVESGLGQGFLPHHNWGAETAGSSWTGDTFEHEDSRWTKDGIVTYVTSFRDYPDDDAAALGLVKLLRSQYAPALSAANAGNWKGAATELYRLGYYKGVKPPSGAIADYYSALSKWLRKQGINPASGFPLLGAALGAAAAWVAVRALRRS
jgi:hypothetical protein